MPSIYTVWHTISKKATCLGSQPPCLLPSAEICAGATYAYVLLLYLYLGSFKYRSCRKCHSGFAVIAVLAGDVLIRPITFLPPLCVRLQLYNGGHQHSCRYLDFSFGQIIVHTSHLVKSFGKIKRGEIWKQNLCIQKPLFYGRSTLSLSRLSSFLANTSG